MLESYTTMTRPEEAHEPCKCGHDRFFHFLEDFGRLTICRPNPTADGMRDICICHGFTVNQFEYLQRVRRGEIDAEAIRREIVSQD
jgi:hypothetical protein